MQIPAGRFYELYFDPAYEFDADGAAKTDPRELDFVSPGKQEYMRRRIDRIAKSIKERGLCNPGYIEIRPAGAILHPGQTRCRALRRLGITTMPCLIVDLVGDYDGPGEPIAPCEAMKLFTDDLKLTIKDNGHLRLACHYPLFDGEALDKSMTITHDGNGMRTKPMYFKNYSREE